MAGNKLNFQIITPTKKVLDEMVDSVILRTLTGEMGVLYDHEPVVTLLDYNAMRYKVEGKSKTVTVMGGFAEITSDKVIVLTDASELLDDIDLERAKKAKERAEGRLSKSEYDQKRAEVALKKSLARINATQSK
ncbi:MAG: F0F1 ATP synthase subunit epsilon [Cellulosilyticaceae bacterium]